MAVDSYTIRVTKVLPEPCETVSRHTARQLRLIVSGFISMSRQMAYSAQRYLLSFTGNYCHFYYIAFVQVFQTSHMVHFHLFVTFQWEQDALSAIRPRMLNSVHLVGHAICPCSANFQGPHCFAKGFKSGFWISLYLMYSSLGISPFITLLVDFASFPDRSSSAPWLVTPFDPRGLPRSLPAFRKTWATDLSLYFAANILAILYRII